MEGYKKGTHGDKGVELELGLDKDFAVLLERLVDDLSLRLDAVTDLGHTVLRLLRPAKKKNIEIPVSENKNKNKSEAEEKRGEDARGDGDGVC